MQLWECYSAKYLGCTKSKAFETSFGENFPISSYTLQASLRSWSYIFATAVFRFWIVGNITQNTFTSVFWDMAISMASRGKNQDVGIEQLRLQQMEEVYKKLSKVIADEVLGQSGRWQRKFRSCSQILSNMIEEHYSKNEQAIHSFQQRLPALHIRNFWTLRKITMMRWPSPL